MGPDTREIIVMGSVMAGLVAARRALFDLPPGATLALLAAAAGLLVLVCVLGTLVVFDVLDTEPAPLARHRVRPGCVRVDMLCQGMSYLSPQRGREASTDHRLIEPPGSTPGPAPLAPTT